MIFWTWKLPKNSLKRNFKIDITFEVENENPSIVAHLNRQKLLFQMKYWRFSKISFFGQKNRFFSVKNRNIGEKPLIPPWKLGKWPKSLLTCFNWSKNSFCMTLGWVQVISATFVKYERAYCRTPLYEEFVKIIMSGWNMRFI